MSIELENKVLKILFENQVNNGQEAYMTGPNVGRKLSTYRQPYQKRANDPLSRIHYDILKKLRREKRVEHIERTGWRLTKTEYDKLKALYHPNS